MQSEFGHYRLLCDAEDFRAAAGAGMTWDEARGRLRLADAQQPRFSMASDTSARAAHDAAPALVMDPFGQLGLLSADARRLLWASDWDSRAAAREVTASAERSTADRAGELSQAPVEAPPDCRFTALALGGDGRVALPFSDGTRHGLQLVHLAHRWQTHCALSDRAHAVCVDDANRIWMADAGGLSLCTGEPLPQAYTAQPDRFEPVQLNPDFLRQRWRQPLPAGHEVLALCGDTRRIYLLTREDEGDRQCIVSRPASEETDAEWQIQPLPGEVPAAVDVGVLARGRLALMLAADPETPGWLDLPVVDVADPAAARLLARRYPQRSQAHPCFVPTTAEGLYYLSDTGPARLYPLPQARFAAQGDIVLERVLDAGRPDTCWHRVYLDACIPPGCDLELAALAYDDYARPPDDWQVQPRPAWQPVASELPFYRGAFDPVPEREGLFETLLQRESGAVRELRGRYLRLRLRMQGDGRHSPAIAAMRVYFPRLSWQTCYLPELFHQETAPDGLPGPANGADVRERMLAAFEGMLTPLEARIANAECWLYPMGTPESDLPALANALGMALPEHWPTVRRRRWLQAAGRLQRLKGTYAGLCLALDIATDGAVGRSQVVPVENYRLRRTLATILGVDLDDAANPLTLGTRQSGNSIVGESLILGAREGRDFLALVAPELADKAGDAEAVAAFFDRYAYRVSIILHIAAGDYRETVRHVLASFLPAHLEASILPTEKSFVLGLSPLLGIDTYLDAAPGWRQIVLDHIRLGRDGRMRNPVAFDPSRVNPAGDLT